MIDYLQLKHLTGSDSSQRCNINLQILAAVTEIYITDSILCWFISLYFFAFLLLFFLFCFVLLKMNGHLYKPWY